MKSKSSAMQLSAVTHKLAAALLVYVCVCVCVSVTVRAVVNFIALETSPSSSPVPFTAEPSLAAF